MGTRFVLIAVACVLVLARPGMSSVAGAFTCDPFTPFGECNGECPPGLMCAEALAGQCGCVPLRGSGQSHVS